jgi:hypothetical protein
MLIQLDRQDLYSSMMTGSNRIVDHTTFSEMQWRRDPFSSHLFNLAPGFQALSHLLPDEFIEILEDIHALQCIRDEREFSCEDPIPVSQVDNLQASVGSRIVGLPKLSLLLDCCYLAAHLCTCMLCCKGWKKSVIPVCYYSRYLAFGLELTDLAQGRVSQQLLSKLQESVGNPLWDGHSNLLIWMLHVGGSFAPVGDLRSQYILLVRENYDARFRDLYNSWPELLAILKRFIWSDKAYMSKVETFWQEYFIQ